MKILFVVWEESSGHAEPHIVKGIFSTMEKAKIFVAFEKHNQYMFIKEVKMDFKYKYDIFEDLYETN